MNWTNFIREAGGAVQWSASTPTVAGTNATAIASAWVVKNQGNNAPLNNNGMVLEDSQSIWAAPGPGDYVTFENSSTKFIIDSDVSSLPLLVMQEEIKVMVKVVLSLSKKEDH